jgi:hypothetical protein
LLDVLDELLGVEANLILPLRLVIYIATGEEGRACCDVVA